MRRIAVRWLRRLAVAVLLVVATIVGVRAWDSLRGPTLSPWHTYVPAEMKAAELDRSDWAAFLAAEDRVFAAVEANVAGKLDPEARVPANRYFQGSALHPARMARDWNRSFVLEPAGPARGAVVLIHGLTDSPYSVRHIAGLYRDHGFVAIAVRMPGHGTVPAGLTEADWEDWSAATRLAMREARRRAGPDAPLHLVGYSNGGALAVNHALDALTDRSLPRPDRIVLFSPMIGVTAFARFAGLAGLPAILPSFAKAAWLSIVPEYNPFKYNSFPVKAAQQSDQLSRTVQRKVRVRARDGVIGGMPPVLTFQSVMDSTVSTPALLTRLFAHLPANGSEVVLFDVNEAAKVGPLLRPAARQLAGRLLPSAPTAFRTTLVGAGEGGGPAVARSWAPGTGEETSVPLGLAYPRDVYSLSHVATPFPPSDGLYGSDPDPADDFGVQLGTIATRGESGTLIADLDSILRASSNPFYAFVGQKIAATLPP